MGEFEQELLWKTPNFGGILGGTLDFCSMTLLKMMSSDRELNSASTTTKFRISTNSWANPDKKNANLLLTLLASFPENFDEIKCLSKKLFSVRPLNSVRTFQQNVSSDLQL